MKKNAGVVVVIAMFILSGCTHAPTTEDKADNRLQVVASFYPLAFIAERVGGEKVDVTSIVGAADPHEYNPSPQDIITMRTADVVLLFGASLEPWGADIIRQRQDADKHFTVVSDGLDLYKKQSAIIDEHEDEHESGDEYAHEHETNGYDPHAWTDPVLAQTIVQIVTQALQDADTTHTQYYQERAQQLIAEFVALDNLYRTGLAQCTQQEVIVSHDAFGYIARRYGFHTQAIAGLSTQDEPSAKLLAQIKDHIPAGANVILAEENSVQRFAQTLADETGLQMLSIDALGRGTRDAEQDYFARARINLDHLRTALNCQ